MLGANLTASSRFAYGQLEIYKSPSILTVRGELRSFGRPNVIFRFDDCLVDTEWRELRRDGVLCLLEPRVFDLLEYLLRNRHRFVSKTDLQNAIWGGRIVSSAALHTRINAVRSAIGDNGAEQRLIRTLRTKGFCFIGDVHEETRSNWSTRTEGSDRSRALFADHPTIAVLPFANNSADPSQNSLAEALTENLITALSKVGWLSVATRTTSFACKGLTLGPTQSAHRLGVRYLLDGSIRQISDRVRITVQLIDSFADFQVWTEQYERDVIDSFGVLEEVCNKVVATLLPQLYLAEHLRVQRKAAMDLNGWECIVRALSLMSSRVYRDAVSARAVLEKALSIDPESAECYSLLSIVCTFFVHMSWIDRQNVVPNALALARKALVLNPDLPWAHAALGYAAIWNRPEEAIVPCQRAIKLNPNFAAAHYFLALASTYSGHCDHVFEHADKLERLAERDLLARGYVGAHDNIRATASFAIERYREGINFARRAAAYLPNSPPAHRALAINLALAGQFDEARQEVQTLRRFSPKFSQIWIKQNYAVWASDEVAKRFTEAFRMAGLR
jgi:TolB-like protein/tetratricopeptide (TPR) repeat protein